MILQKDESSGFSKMQKNLHKYSLYHILLNFILNFCVFEYVITIYHIAVIYSLMPKFSIYTDFYLTLIKLTTRAF